MSDLNIHSRNCELGEVDLCAPFTLKKYNINKVRENYSRAVKNPNPSYEVPDSHVHRLPFIIDMVNKSRFKDVTRSDVAMYSRIVGDRKKAYYPDREKAIRALFTVFCEHLNVVTHQVERSIRNASDDAGLSTISEAELKKAEDDKSYTAQVSISRASRAFKDMILLGWIIAPNAWQVWDKERGYWIDKYFEVTPLFFRALGITDERVKKQQENRLKYLKDKALVGGMTPESVGRMSITQIKAERKLAWRRNAFDRRAKEQARKKEHTKLNGCNRDEQRQAAIVNVIKALGDSISQIGTDEFTDMVNKEIARLRKFTNIKPPLH